MSIDDKLYGWDAGLKCLIRQLEGYRRRHMALFPRTKRTPDLVLGWDDAIGVAQRLCRDARTQKGLVARECAAVEVEENPDE